MDVPGAATKSIRFAAGRRPRGLLTQALKRLSRLMAEGKGDTDEADALRDEVDVVSRQLASEEIERLNGLSADLYMLTDEEVFDPLQPGEEQSHRTPDLLRRRLREAQEREDAWAILTLLREGTAGLDRCQRACLRAHAYEALGHLDTAHAFMSYATELDPTEDESMSPE